MEIFKRKIHIKFSGTLELWLSDRPFTRSLLYSYTILVPDSEKFIIRTVLNFSPVLNNDLKQYVNALIYQEGQHAREHNKANLWIETQGYKVGWFRRLINFLTYTLLEYVLSKRQLLSIAAATEHLNTSLSMFFLKNPNLFKDCPHTLTALYSWHFAEEIEHKEVVYDVFNAVSGSYVTRLAGALIAGFGFFIILPIGAVIFSIQDLSFLRFCYWKDLLSSFFKIGKLFPFLFMCLFEYLKPQFHPRKTENIHLIALGLDQYHITIGDKNDPS